MKESGREDRLRLAPHLRLALLDDETAFAVGEGQRLALRGRAAVRVASLLDGEHTASEIVAAVAGECTLDTAENALEALLHAGVARAVTPEAGEQAGEAFDAAGGGAARPLPTIGLQVTGAGPCELVAERVGAALGAAGFTLRGDGEVLVIACDDYLSRELPALYAAFAARAAAGQARACALLKPTGRRALLGPIFVPGEGPCLECLRHALARQRPLETALTALGRELTLPASALDPSTDAAASLFAVALWRWLAGTQSRPPLAGCVTMLDTASLELTHHPVTRRPQCPACGDVRLVATRALTCPTWTDAPAHVRDGGLRREDPSETYARLSHLVSELLGPVTFLRAEPPEAGTPPVFLSGFMASAPDRSWLERPGNPFDQVCAGKGFTHEQARMSALGEAIERQLSLFQGDEARLVASRAELTRCAGAAVTRRLQSENTDFARSLERAPLRVLHPDELELFSSRQLEAGGDDAFGPTRVPERYPGDASIAWTPVWPLAGDGVALAPLASLYTRVPDALGSRYSVASSNGCASGATLAEAALQGLFELIERDAVAIWWYCRLRRPELELAAVKLTAVQRETLDAFRLRLAAKGFESWLLDLTHDLGVPVAVAVAHERATGRFAFGFGCHSHAPTSVTRAWSELAQLLRGSRAVATPWDAVRDTDHRFLFPCAETKGHWAEAAAHGSHLAELGDASQELERVTALLAARGLSAFVADKSRPDVALHVAHVLVPGLRHVWPRFASGRLYDVPVMLGLRERAALEHELNPVPLLI